MWKTKEEFDDHDWFEYWTYGDMMPTKVENGKIYYKVD